MSPTYSIAKQQQRSMSTVAKACFMQHCLGVAVLVCVVCVCERDDSVAEPNLAPKSPEGARAVEHALQSSKTE
jgi:hypothetical protein